MAIRVCVAGATGWVGRLLVKRLLESTDFSLSGAIAQTAAGQDIGTAIGRTPAGLTVSASLDEALSQPTDVLVDYTRPDTVKQRALTALSRGVRVVIGTSGLNAQDYTEIEQATRPGLGVIAAG